MATDGRISTTTSRRTLTKGAVWSAPVIVGVGAAPSMAASGCITSCTETASAPLTTSGVKVTSTWPVPAGVTSIDFSVLGGGGGGVNTALSGGAGGLVTGTLSVTPGEVLTLTVGAGGTGPAQNGVTGTVWGGTGWGDGGTGGNIPVSTLNYGGGGGGGGSAIERSDGTAVVVAGGGGGCGRRINSPGITSQTTDAVLGVGADGDMDAVFADRTWDPAGTFVARVASQGGKSAKNGGAGGQGADSLVSPLPVGPAPDSFYEKATGNGGVAKDTTLATGSNGGAGNYVTYPTFGTNPTISAGGIASGGGGGGYGGGGGGAVVIVRYNDTVDSSTVDAVLGVSAGGGGGGNYVDTAVVTNVEWDVGGTRATSPSVHVPGAIVLTYCVQTPTCP